ncbi:MAG: RNA polymerase sigma factor [Candidatus Paceibacterota bacterium]|jgi:RNA polymerase sigma-70 factor (ECF subfamily)
MIMIRSKTLKFQEIGMFFTAEVADDVSLKRDEEVLSLSIDKPKLFEVIVNRYQAAFIRKVKSIIGDREDVDDIVQETFAKIYFNAGRFQPVVGATFKSWAYKILMNVTFTHYQKLKRDGENLADLDPDIYAVLPDTKNRYFEKDFVRDAVESVLTRMPKDLASVLVSHFLEGRPQKEIAKGEGVTIGAIKTRVYRAKKEFKKVSDAIQPKI